MSTCDQVPPSGSTCSTPPQRPSQPVGSRSGVRPSGVMGTTSHVTPSLVIHGLAGLSSPMFSNVMMVPYGSRVDPAHMLRRARGRGLRPGAPIRGGPGTDAAIQIDLVREHRAWRTLQRELLIYRRPGGRARKSDGGEPLAFHQPDLLFDDLASRLPSPDEVQADALDLAHDRAGGVGHPESGRCLLQADHDERYPPGPVPLRTVQVPSDRGLDLHVRDVVGQPEQPPDPRPKYDTGNAVEPPVLAGSPSRTSQSRAAGPGDTSRARSIWSQWTVSAERQSVVGPCVVSHQ